MLSDNSLSTPGKKKKKSPNTQNFIEAIRDIGGSFAHQAKDLTGGAANSAVNSLLGKNDNLDKNQPKSNENFDFNDYLTSREKQIRDQERALSGRLRENEKIIYFRKDEETKQQIICIQEEIKKIIKETGQMAIELIEAEKSVSTQVVVAGSYHLNFFARIRQLLLIARKRISDSKEWLSLFNSRQNRKGLYWNKVKKSGTKFMLSHERYMATQSG